MVKRLCAAICLIAACWIALSAETQQGVWWAVGKHPDTRPAQTLYALIVINGTGSGLYPPGAVVGISANAAAVGMTFSAWTGATVANPMSAVTTLTMPASSATVTATYIATGGGGGGGSGNTYYVSTFGDDNNSCQTAKSTVQSNQKRHISSGVACLSAGDTLLIHGGTYTDALDSIDSAITTVRSGTAASPITISAFPGGLAATLTPGPRADAETVVIQVPYSFKGISLTIGGPSYLIFADLVIDMTNQTLGDNSQGPAGFYESTGSVHNTLIHSEVKNNGAVGISTSKNNGSADYFNVLYCLLHDNGRNTTAPDNGYGIYANTSFNLFDGNEIYNNHGYGIQFNSWPSGNIVRNNLVHDNFPWAAAVGGGVGGVTGGGITVQGDTDDERGNPLGHVNDNQIYNNVVWHNGFVAGGAGSCIQAYTWTRNTTIYNNTCYNNNGDGIVMQYYDSAFPPIVRNNISWSNVGTNIKDYGALNGSTGSPIVDHNTTTDPSFVNAGAADFRIQVGSIARSAGIAIGIATDRTGYPQTSPPTNGAYVYH